MDSKTLLQKYRALLAENEALKEENLSSKARLSLAEPAQDRSCSEEVERDVPWTEEALCIHEKSDPLDKIRLFMSLFKGREDLYARRPCSKKRVSR